MTDGGGSSMPDYLYGDCLVSIYKFNYSPSPFFHCAEPPQTQPGQALLALLSQSVTGECDFLFVPVKNVNVKSPCFLHMQNVRTTACCSGTMLAERLQERQRQSSKEWGWMNPQ